jgi:uncharacterized protein YdaU (DUF1376 family)
MASNSERAANSFMPLYGGDYLRDTMHLSCTEHGVYLRLLIHYWHTQRPLPNDMTKLAAIAGCRNEADTNALQTIYQQYFKSRRGHGNLLHNKRMDKEIKKASEFKEKMRQAGLKSAAARLQPSSTNPQPTFNYPPPQPLPQPEKLEKKKRRGTPLPSDFKISDRVKSWAHEKGLTDLESDLEFFVGRMKANGKTYVDWDEAFMNCVREDWAGLRKGKQ